MMNRGRTTRVAQGVGYYALMSVVTVLAVFPFYWMLVSSFKTENDLFQINPTLLPPSISLEHYERLINGTGFARQFGNSTAVAIITMVLVILISSLAGYALSRYRFTGGNEFAVLMPESDEAAAEQAMQRIRRLVRLNNAETPGAELSISVGYSCGQKGSPLLEVQRTADRGMYRNKQNHKTESTNR